jgi:hypothetical protein
MDVYTFLSVDWPSVRAFSPDATGGNLPKAYAPWHACGLAALLGVDKDPVTKAMQRDGYFLVTTKAYSRRGRSED